MNEGIRLRQLRTFLYALAAAMFAGTVLELLAVEHYQDAIQLIPFGLCALGVLAIGLVWLKPGPTVVLAFRVFMVITAVGSLFGVYKHLEGNYEFAHELRPRAGFSDLLEATLKGGAPMMAPGILAIGAIIAVAATFASVAVESRSVVETEAQSIRPQRWLSRPSSR